jgi:hypothetical protein
MRRTWLQPSTTPPYHQAYPIANQVHPNASQAPPVLRPQTQVKRVRWIGSQECVQSGVSLSPYCHSPYRPGLLSLGSSREPPSLLPASHHTPIFQEMPARISSAAVLYADLLHPHFPPSITQHSSLYNLLDIQPISLRSLPPPDSI